MSLIIISCRKISLIMPLKLSQTNLLGFVPFLVLCYPTHSSLGLRLNNHVGPAGSTVSKPILTLPSHLLFHVPRNVFQEDLLHYFPRSRVCMLLFHFFRDLEPCSRVVTANAPTDYFMLTRFFLC